MGIASRVKYGVAQLVEHGSDVSWWRDRMQCRVNKPFQQRLWPAAGGIDVPAADWDTLIVIDGCRRDLFEDLVDCSRFDSYRSVTSRGSATKEWCRRNWTGEYDDTVYVTGNPVPPRSIPGSLVELREVAKDEFDRDLGTVPAPAVTKAAREAHRDYPNKRLVVHYLQPHYPFIGYPELQFTSWNQTPEMRTPENDHLPSDVWHALGEAIVDEERVWEGYRDNLRYVLDEVWRLISSLDGKTVVTSDHGNCLGERSAPVPVRTFGHPPGLRLTPLIDVPWGVVDKERREIISDVARDQVDVAETDQRSAQLEALGYV